MHRPWAPTVIVVLLAGATVGGLACSRSSLLSARPDGAAERQLVDAQAQGPAPSVLDGSRPDAQAVRPADAAPSDRPVRSSCGNGQLDPGEECEDGNTRGGDGCSKDCRLEDPCVPCRSGCPGCLPLRDPSCGNARVSADEACDDGNAVSGDGCSADCKAIEPGFRCPVPGRRCLPICGDGLLVGWETQLEREPPCEGDPGAACGDGLITHYEECDCGNGVGLLPVGCDGPNGDGYGQCTTRCTWGPFCGDGMVNGPDEKCDLGNKNGTPGREGCTAGCKTPHYCGDGIIDTDHGEECDLGDLNGVRLDRDGQPSNDPDALVMCRTDCTFAIPVI